MRCRPTEYSLVVARGQEDPVKNLVWAHLWVLPWVLPWAHLLVHLLASQSVLRWSLRLERRWGIRLDQR
jgi:cytochrome c oxidase subunit IV